LYGSAFGGTAVDRRSHLADHRGVALRGVVVVVPEVGRARRGGFGALLPAEARDRGCGDDRRRPGEEVLAAQLFSHG
jgi:hypothetical protein